MMFDSSPTNSWQRKFAESYQKTLLAASDLQSILSIAYWVNFYVDGKCKLSAYHYSLVRDIGFIALSSFVASTLTIRNYYKTPLAAALRFSCIITVLSLINVILFIQRDQDKFPELLPSFSRNTSAIFLPASCFLDPAFHVFEVDENLQNIDQIGKSQNTSWIYIMFMASNILILVMGFFRNVFRDYLDKTNPKEDKPHAMKRSFILLYRVLAFLVIFATTIFAWFHIIWLRVFVNHSGWIKLNSNHKNPENTFGEIGQLVPLFSMTAILITFASGFTWPREQDSMAGIELWNRL